MKYKYSILSSSEHNARTKRLSIKSDAEKKFRDVGDVRKKVLGEKDAGTLTTNNWIAKCLYEKKQFNNAEEMFNDVENLQKAILGVKHPNILLTIYWIARCLYKKTTIQ